MMAAILLIQDVQLLCFTVVFGVFAMQRWKDAPRRWLWYTFLANAVGAILDFSAPWLPRFVNQGISFMLVPLSYALLNIACMYFVRRSRWLTWLSYGILVGLLPVFVMMSGDATPVRPSALGDLAIALECAITPAILLPSREKATRAPRLLMGWFLILFVVEELARVWVAFGMHLDPDVATPNLMLTSGVFYIVNVCMLPLLFVWMMNARLEAELQQQAIVDPLTDVLNRRGLDAALDAEFARFRRYREDLSVVLLDIDHFKQFNDRLGHAAGDAVLVEMASLLRRRMRDTDVVGRLGGEEFALVLPRTGLQEAQAIVETLSNLLRDHTYVLGKNPVHVTTSWGVATTAGRAEIGSQQLLHEADIALYRAKNNGRDQVCVFAPKDEVDGPMLIPTRLRAQENQ